MGNFHGAWETSRIDPKPQNKILTGLIGVLALSPSMVYSEGYFFSLDPELVGRIQG
jgi:hypothetical protein